MEKNPLNLTLLLQATFRFHWPVLPRSLPSWIRRFLCSLGFGLGWNDDICIHLWSEVFSLLGRRCVNDHMARWKTSAYVAFRIPFLRVVCSRSTWNWKVNFTSSVWAGPARVALAQLHDIHCQKMCCGAGPGAVGATANCGVSRCRHLYLNCFSASSAIARLAERNSGVLDVPPPVLSRAFQDHLFSVDRNSKRVCRKWSMPAGAFPWYCDSNKCAQDSRF